MSSRLLGKIICKSVFGPRIFSQKKNNFKFGYPFLLCKFWKIYICALSLNFKIWNTSKNRYSFKYIPYGHTFRMTQPSEKSIERNSATHITTQTTDSLCSPSEHFHVLIRYQGHSVNYIHVHQTPLSRYLLSFTV